MIDQMWDAPVPRSFAATSMGGRDTTSQTTIGLTATPQAYAADSSQCEPTRTAVGGGKVFARISSLGSTEAPRGEKVFGGGVKLFTRFRVRYNSYYPDRIKMSSRNLYIAAVIACMTGGLFGYSVGYIGGILVLPSFMRHFALDKLDPQTLASQQSRIVSSWLVGCVIGVPIGVPVCAKLGRKLCITFSAVLYVIGAIMQLIQLDGLLLFQAGRLINGIGVGAGTLVSPLFISEISPPSQRGALMSGYQVAIQLFALLGFWGAFASNSIFPTTSNLQWQIPVSIQLVPGVILLLGCLFILPESPRWLIANDKEEAADKSLSWLRMHDQNSPEVTSESKEIYRVVQMHKRNIELQPKSSFISKIVHQPLRKRMIVGVCIMIAQNLVGLNALNYYAPIIFKSAGFSSVSASLFLTGVFGLVKVLTSLAFMFVFIRVRGNRFWLQLGTTVMAVSMFILAYCVEESAKRKPGSGSFSAVGIIAVLMVYIFAFAFGVSLGPISWNVCAEIFPSYINTQACAVTTCVQWLSQIFIAAVTPPMIASIGYGTYIFYGVCCVLSFVWCYFCVPETRGVPFGPAMDKVFGQTTKPDPVPTAEEVEDVSEETPLIANNNRRRSSVAFVV